MKLKKPDWKFIGGLIVGMIIGFLLFHNWDEVKAFIAGIFS
ncbi:MAG: hypothetical protein ABFS10_07945 [Bacteroidota bacterium]